MKKSIAFVFVLLVVTAAYSQVPEQISEGYGTRVNFTYAPIDPDYLGVETSGQLHQPMNGFYTIPALSPDGNLIAFSNCEYIFLVPAEGGEAEMKYASIYLYPYNGSNIILYETINKLLGFSRDGRRLYFMHNLMDEESGTVINVTEGKNGLSMGIKSGVTRMALASLDIETGEVQTLVRNVGMAALSPSRNYLLYCVDDSKKIRVEEIESGEGWDVPLPDNFGYTFACSADEQYIIYSANMGETESQLFRMPIKGGVSEQLTSYKGGDSGYRRYNPVCTPNGEWILYDDIGRATYSNNITSPDGKSSISYENKSVVKICAFNVESGETIDLFPSSTTIDERWGTLSSDGKQLCYIRNDHESFTERYGIYIKDIPLPEKGTNEQLSVSDAKPLGFTLTGNYPNPFNPLTTISFTLPVSCIVDLSVCDVTGREVRALVSGYRSAGENTAIWDGRDDSGKPVSSGVYLSYLRVGNTVRTNRMLLIK